MKYWKFGMWAVIGAILIFGGFAFNLTPGYASAVKAFSRIAIILGVVIWGGILIKIMNKHLNN